MRRRTRVLIDPTSRILYSSFYIKGLCDVFGKQNVSFSSQYFRDLKREQESHSYDHYMAFVVISPTNDITKYIIDFRDKPSVKERAYCWCDRYAKINFNLDLTDERFHDKVISIPPGFGIRIWNIWETAYFCLSNYFHCRLSPLVSLKHHLGDYLAQYKRPTLADVTSIADSETNICDKPYVFMIGTLWPHRNCIEGTNLHRRMFIDVCQSLNCRFEGGFLASVDHPQYGEFRDAVLSKPYSVDSYVRKTKLSTVVFNTPSVHDCHGWKLGEYLAMGKAIVSTPLSNQLPEDLVHGKNVHIVSDMNELKGAIELLLRDESYRKRLEDGARAYFAKYVIPARVIENILRD